MSEIDINKVYESWQSLNDNLGSLIKSLERFGDFTIYDTTSKPTKKTSVEHHLNCLSYCLTDAIKKSCDLYSNVKPIPYKESYIEIRFDQLLSSLQQLDINFFDAWRILAGDKTDNTADDTSEKISKRIQQVYKHYGQQLSKCKKNIEMQVEDYLDILRDDNPAGKYIIPLANELSEITCEPEDMWLVQLELIRKKHKVDFIILWLKDNQRPNEAEELEQKFRSLKDNFDKYYKNMCLYIENYSLIEYDDNRCFVLYPKALIEEQKSIKDELLYYSDWLKNIAKLIKLRKVVPDDSTDTIMIKKSELGKPNAKYVKLIEDLEGKRPGEMVTLNNERHGKGTDKTLKKTCPELIGIIHRKNGNVYCDKIIKLIK